LLACTRPLALELATTVAVSLLPAAAAEVPDEPVLPQAVSDKVVIRVPVSSMEWEV